MKKLLMAAVALCSLAATYSCMGGDNENHGTMIYNRDNKAMTELFADQTLDSLHIVSYDSWRASTKMLDGGDWFTITPDTCVVPVNYIVQRSVYLKTTPNTTGKMRSGVIMVKTTYPEYGDLSTYVYQYGWLNINVPVPSFEKKEGDEVHAVFNAELRATDNLALFACTVYAQATLTSDASWLTIPNEDQHLAPGNYGMKFVVTPNNTGEPREAHVTLTSNGVSNVITYKQKGKE